LSGNSALILLGHGARAPEWAASLLSVREKICATAPAGRVELAFLSFIPPDLSAKVEELAAAGIQRVTVLPMFMAQGGHLQQELPALIARLQTAHPALKLNLAPAIGASGRVLAAMAEEAGRYLEREDGRP
jgi:sirohydrochlorin cobaltochelatase